VETLADGLEAAQVMVFVQELLGAGQLVLCQEADLNAVQELLLCDRERSYALTHEPKVKRRIALVQSSELTTSLHRLGGLREFAPPSL
jgi:hypothetical protein